MIETSHALPPGTKIDKYEIYKGLGEGGFGITYRAENSAINTMVLLLRNCI